jgi:hypothetical protein
VVRKQRSVVGFRIRRIFVLLAFRLSSLPNSSALTEKLEEAGFQFEVFSDIGNCARIVLVAVEDVAEGGFEVLDRNFGSDCALTHLFVVAAIAVITKESCGRIVRLARIFGS